MACTDPRHADCPNCDGEVLVGVFDPINIKTIDKATGEVTREVVNLPKHVLSPLACPKPLVLFLDLVVRARQGDAEATRHLAKGWPAKVVREALGSAFKVTTDAARPEMVSTIQPA